MKGKLILVIILFAIAAVLWGVAKRGVPRGPVGVPDGEQVFCTMDAMMCPDGSYVGRTGPNCEFVCPGV